MSRKPQAAPLPKEARKVFTGKLFSVWQWEQKLYDGTTTTFERISRPDYAYVIGVLPNKKILLVRDTQPDREPVLTPAGGKVESEESAAQAAAREFLEETGYRIGRLALWHTYRPSYKMEMLTHAFIGRDLEKVQPQQPEAGEKIELQEFPFDEFVKLGRSAMLRDWMLRIKLLEAQLDQKKRDELLHALYD